VAEVKPRFGAEVPRAATGLALVGETGLSTEGRLANARDAGVRDITANEFGTSWETLSLEPATRYIGDAEVRFAGNTMIRSAGSTETHFIGNGVSGERLNLRMPTEERVRTV
jgi:hypothetical protein